MNLITNDITKMLASIEQIVDIDEAILMLKKVDAFKTLLDSMNAFHENAIRYAQLEAFTLLRIVQLGGGKGLKGTHKRTALWLESLTPEEQQKYISMCSEGLTIDQVWRREVGNKEAYEESRRMLSVMRAGIEEKLRDEGIVDISLWYDKVRAYCHDDAEFDDWVDGTRNQLRRRGGVGTGVNTTYVDPYIADKYQIYRAIVSRICSIQNDMLRLAEIWDSAGINGDITVLRAAGYSPKSSVDRNYEKRFEAILGFVADEFGMKGFVRRTDSE